MDLTGSVPKFSYLLVRLAYRIDKVKTSRIM